MAGQQEMRSIPVSYTHLSQVSFSIGSGETLGLLGESGSGKSTVGQMVAGILRPTAGRLFFQGEELSFPFRGEARRGIQILFQHPEVSFNPRLRLWDSIKEPYLSLIHISARW